MQSLIRLGSGKSRELQSHQIWLLAVLGAKA